jgi:hypothetical protein
MLACSPKPCDQLAQQFCYSVDSVPGIVNKPLLVIINVINPIDIFIYDEHQKCTDSNPAAI